MAIIKILHACFDTYRYTPEEYDLYRDLCERLGHGYMKSRLVVAFTFGDRLDHKLEDDIRHADGTLKV
jgi:hypothetical protein